MCDDLPRRARPKKRYALWERVQAVFYADAGRIKFGDYFRLDARRKEAQGHEPGPYVHFRNVGWTSDRPPPRMRTTEA